MIKKEYWDKKTPIELKIGDKKSKVRFVIYQLSRIGHKTIVKL